MKTTRTTESVAGVSGRRRSRSGGNALLEAVFTLVPTMALICGFIDIGLVLYRWCTLQNAVREGCRYAITFQTVSGKGQDASIMSVVEQYALGLVKASDSTQHIFVNYYSTGNLSTAIASGGNIPGNIVEVSVQNVSWSWIAPLSGTITNPLYSSTPLTFKVYSSDILGGYPAGVNSVSR